MSRFGFGFGPSLSLRGRRGGGAAYSAEATAAFAAMDVQPSSALKDIYATAIDGLVAAGLWAIRDAYYFLNVETAQAARVNLKNPGTYNLTAFNSPAFTAKVGYAGNGSTSYLDSNFNPSTAGGIWAQNDASIFVWSLTSGQAASAILGYNGSGNYPLYTRYTTNQTFGAINSTSPMTVANLDGSGFYCVTRSGAEATKIFKNGADHVTGTQTSAALSNLNVTLLRDNATYSSRSVAFFGFGGHVTDAQASDEYDILSAFKTAVDALP